MLIFRTMLFFILFVELVDDDVEFFLKVFHLSAKRSVIFQRAIELGCNFQEFGAELFVLSCKF